MSGLSTLLAIRSEEDAAEGKLRVDAEITDLDALIDLIQSVNSYNADKDPGILLIYINVNLKLISKARRSDELLELLAASKLQGIAVSFTDPPAVINPNDPAVAMQVIKDRTDLQNIINNLRADRGDLNSFRVLVPTAYKEAYDAVLDVSEDKFAEKLFTLYWKQFWLKEVNKTRLPPEAMARILLTEKVDLKILFKDDYAKIEASKAEFIRVVNEVFAESFAFLRATGSETQIPVIQRLLLRDLIDGEFSSQQGDASNLLVITPTTTLKEDSSSYQLQTDARNQRSALAAAVRNLFGKYTLGVPLNMETGHNLSTTRTAF